MEGAPMPKLLHLVRRAIRTRHYSPRTEQAYVHWIRRFIFFHKLRHPADMGNAEINAFLTHLAVSEQVSASTQTQALSALVFLYQGPSGPEPCSLTPVFVRPTAPRSERRLDIGTVPR
jgi:hypothetical protein